MARGITGLTLYSEEYKRISRHSVLARSVPRYTIYWEIRVSNGNEGPVSYLTFMGLHEIRISYSVRENKRVHRWI